MSNTTSTLLTHEERLSLYAPPSLKDTERTAYFTFSNLEITALLSFDNIKNAVYFAISLAFFKLKYTLVNFTYREVTFERQHVMQRYFPNQASPRHFPDDKDTIARIENKVLDLVGFSRFRKNSAETILFTLQEQAASYPRQRQLCKALLTLMIEKKIAVPSFITLQYYVTKIWNIEQLRLVKNYYRYTTKIQRESVLSMLDKTDDHHRIVSIKKDMKAFNTESIVEELEKHQQLMAIFLIARTILPKLKLPDATIAYHAELINYYNGARLKQLNSDTVSLYLLCYSYSRFQILNDHLLEAFKKRTLNYLAEINEKAGLEVNKFMETLKTLRYKMHDLLMTIKNDTHKTAIKKSKLYQCIPEPEFESIAQLLIHEKFDKNFHFWKQVDSNSHSIKLNLRPLFVKLDISIVRNDALNEVVIFMKRYLESGKSTSIPNHMITWISKEDLPYVLNKDEIIANRFEFLLYKQLAHHISTNKLILKFSIKHKELDDNFLSLPKWKTEKAKLLASQPYPKLQLKSPLSLLDDKEQSLKLLYQKINYDINNGHNKEIILKPSQFNSMTWRLTPIEKTVEPNESLFSHFPKQNIANVMRFVDNKTNYSNALNSILPRSIRTEQNLEANNAVILSNAIRLGSRAMASVCDFSLNQLVLVEKECIRMETVVAATQIINTKAQELEIFKRYNIAGINHLSLDGLKVATRIQNIKARHSPKFLGNDPGVSSYNAIFNHFPIVGQLIGSNEYEGNFTFGMVHHQNMSDFNIKRASTDRHGKNPFNFGWFDRKLPMTLFDLKYFFKMYKIILNF